MVLNLKRLIVLFGVAVFILRVEPIYAQRGDINIPSPTIGSATSTITPTGADEGERPTRPTVLATATPSAPGGGDTGRTPTNTPQNDGSSRTPADYPTIVGFRSPARTPLGCSDATINENISVVNTGKAGPGCSLNVEVRATGEWVFTGGFFDSPPYVWGQWPERYNSYGDNIFISGAGYAFECSLPAYTLDQSALPTYVTISNEQDNPSTDPFTAPTKRYQLSFAADAPLGQSFTLPLAFSSTCRLIGNHQGNIIVVEPIEPGYYGQCDQAPGKNINPRQKSLQHRITFNETCAVPTPTPPAPTATPPSICGGPCNPTNPQCPIDCPVCAPNPGGENICQPRPSITPPPTTTPPPICGGPCNPNAPQCPIECPECVRTSTSQQAICRPKAQCKCDGLDVIGGKLEKGQTATFAVYVKVDPNNPAGNDAQGQSVVFRLEKKVGATWQEITRSGIIPFAGPTESPGLRRYAATWSTTIPQAGEGVTAYRVKVYDEDILCRYRTVSQATPSPTPRATPSTRSGGLIDNVISLVNNLLGIKTSETTTTDNSLPSGFGPSDIAHIIVPTGDRTLQLGTFDPFATPSPTPYLIKSCKELEFSVNY